MARKHNPEDKTDTASRLKLRDLLKRVQKFLEQTHRTVTSKTSRLNDVVKENITLLWRDANSKLQGVIESLEIGAPKWRRDALEDAGMFGNELDAKGHLFDNFLGEKRFLAVLRFLTSIFGSLSKAFPILSAVKEFIDAVLCARDWLPDDPEITSLGDLR